MQYIKHITHNIETNINNHNKWYELKFIPKFINVLKKSTY